MEECRTCKFFRLRTDAAKDAGGGFCRRYPPFFPSGLSVYENLTKEIRADSSFEVGMSDGFLNDAWPNVHQQSWCGEYSKKPAAKPKPQGNP